MTNKPHTLIADIGGTNARFANFQNQSKTLSDVEILKCSDYEKPEHAIDTYIKNHNIKKLNSICIAAAGPIVNDKVKFTNNSWQISTADLKKRYQTNRVKLLNDIEAICYALPVLTTKQLLSINGKSHVVDKENFTYALIGPGSGLGVASLCCRNKKLFPIVSEGGHISFAPENELQLNLLQVLLQNFNRVTNEHLLSGPGLVNIYNAVCEIESVDYLPNTPAKIFASANDSSDPIATKVVDLFFQILGQVAGDLVLTLGAYDGIFITGGIVQRYPNMLIDSLFRERFEQKNSHQHLLEHTPSWLILDKYPGLLGASIYINNYSDAFN